MKEPGISAENLFFSYPAVEGGKPVEVLHGLNISVEAGTFVAVLGHNGSGKSTFAKHLNAIVLPTGGRVFVCGMDTSDPELLLKIRRYVGMVFQNPDNQLVANVVEEDVAFGPENLGVAPEEIRSRVDAALKQVGMYEYRGQAPYMLSGGQKQRIAMAGILAMRPRCIVLDEPTAMLDPKGCREVIDTVKKLNREAGITVVLITHHMAEAAMADRVIVMSDGKTITEGTPKEVFSQVELLQSVHLTAPDTVRLMYALNREGMELPLDALSVEECARALCAALKTE